MSKPGEKQSYRRKYSLTTEERELWELVTSSVAPLRSQTAATVQSESDAIEGSTAASARKPMSPTTPGERPVTPVRTPPPPPPPSRQTPATAIDRRRHRKIAAGRVEIDARLDLHGMRQDEAHATLRAFLHGCAARGDKLVLIITGKGGTSRGDDDDFDWSQSRDRGVLRRNVPRWLAEPDIARLVVGYTTASARHGGEGALYVQIRARKTAPPLA